MSDRLDVVIVTDGGLAIHHQRWGATSLFSMLLEGPDGAMAQARAFEATVALDDLLAGCVIDVVRRQLLVAGPSEVISASGPRHAEPQEVLRELAPHWPGWHLAYEPAYSLEPVVLYVRGLGLQVDSLNEPHAASDALRRPRFVAPAYTLDAPTAVVPSNTGARPPTAADLTRSLEELDLSVGLRNEVRSANLQNFGDVLGKGRLALARRGLSQRSLDELAEWMADFGFAL